MSIITWYRATFSYRARKNILISVAVFIWTGLVFGYGRLTQSAIDRLTINMLTSTNEEMATQIGADIDEVLEKYKREK